MYYTNFKVLISHITCTLALHTVISSLWMKWTGLGFMGPGIFQFIMIQGITFYLSISTVDMCFGLFFPFKRLNKLDELKSKPEVALLYTVCDDLFYEAISSLANQNYPNYKVYILDDSELFETRKNIDAIAMQYGFIVVRRNSRRGYKAGNLNNWLKKYSHDFQYFVIADSDSILPATFINEILKYAELGANSKVAVFQSKVLYWNTHLRYPKIMNIAQPVSNFFIERFSQRDFIFSNFGRNAIYRIQEINAAGGFSEEYIAEDFALQLDLAKSGFYCRVINLESFEAHPATLGRVRRRMQRWASQTIQLLKYPAKGVPLQLIFSTVKFTFYYLIWTFYCLGLIYLLFSAIFMHKFYSISFVEGLLTGAKAYLHPTALLLIGIFLCQIFIRGYLSYKLKIKISSFLMNCLYSMAEGFYLIFPITFRILKYLFVPKIVFNPTNRLLLTKSKNEDIAWLILFTIIWSLLCTSIFMAPYIFLFNAFWLVPALLSPLLLWKLKTKIT